MIVTPNGKYKAAKGGLCECIVGQDPNSHQPHLIKCKNPAMFMWFWRQWIIEAIMGSAEPIYSRIGAMCCKECFARIKCDGPPADLDQLRKKIEANKALPR